MSVRRNTPLEELLEHAEYIRRLADRWAPELHDAEDLSQAAWLEILRKPPRHRDAVRAWLSRLLRNLAISRHRSDQRRRDREVAVLSERPTATSPEPAELEARLERLSVALESLAPTYREVVELRYIEGVAPAEIAARLDVPVETVYSRLKRALKRLRRSLDTGRPRRDRCPATAGGA